MVEVLFLRYMNLLPCQVIFNLIFMIDIMPTVDWICQDTPNSTRVPIAVKFGFSLLLIEP